MSISKRCFTLAVVVFAMTATSTQSRAQSPHTVVAVKASNPLLHGFEVKTALDDGRRWVSIRGPQLYSSPDALKPGVLPSYLTWYEIRKPGTEPVRKIVVADEFSGEQSFELQLAEPAFYLMAAQSIKDGPPQEVPANLNNFVAFRIVNVDSVALPEPTPGKPVFVCMPAEQWHHAEHLAIKDPRSLLMVYAVDEQASGTKATTIDQFGLNGMTFGKKQYAYVAAKRIGG